MSGVQIPTPIYHRRKAAGSVVRYDSSIWVIDYAYGTGFVESVLPPSGQLAIAVNPPDWSTPGYHTMTGRVDWNITRSEFTPVNRTANAYGAISVGNPTLLQYPSQLWKTTDALCTVINEWLKRYQDRTGIIPAIYFDYYYEGADQVNWRPQGNMFFYPVSTQPAIGEDKPARAYGNRGQGVEGGVHFGFKYYGNPGSPNIQITYTE